jgi:predicted TIM-barrel fold metal-dependent hydrolase
MKLSALPDPTQYPFRPVGPFIKQIVEAFGAERLVWGGAFGPDATPEKYRAGREAIRAQVAQLSPKDQAAILGGTAARLFGFG